MICGAGSRSGEGAMRTGNPNCQHLACHSSSRCRRGQALSYDAIGGVVVFAIAIGILFSYWSSMGASFSDEDAMLVLEANTAIDRILSENMLLQGRYEINKTRLANCAIDRDAAGIAHEYYFVLEKYEGDRLVAVGNPCGSRNIEGKPYFPQNPKKVVRSERIVFYDGGPAKAVLSVYTE